MRGLQRSTKGIARRSCSNVTDTYEYDAFGNLLNKTGTTPNNYLYRGEQFDSDLGLYYLRARYYNRTTGRFTSRDPEDHSLFAPNELHKYLYVNGDPVNVIDPSGRGLVDEAISLGTSDSSLHHGFLVHSVWVPARNPSAFVENSVQVEPERMPTRAQTRAL
jgi:RHS repeat-associated protein